MKKIILLSALVFMGLQSNAQLLKFGFKAGLGTSHYTFEDLVYRDDATNTYMQVIPDGNVTAFKIGATARVKIPIIPLNAQMGIAYANVGGKARIQDGTMNTNFGYSESSSRLDIPMSVALRITKFRIIGGVSYSMDLGRSTNVSDGLTENYVNTGKFNFGVETAKQDYWNWRWGLGFEFKKFGLEAMFDIPMSEDLSFNQATNTYNFGPNPSVFMINFTYFLF